LATILIIFFENQLTKFRAV